MNKWSYIKSYQLQGKYSILKNNDEHTLNKYFSYGNKIYSFRFQCKLWAYFLSGKYVFQQKFYLVKYPLG